MTQPRIRQIVVPIDFSPHSGAAVCWAAYWQQQTGAQVTVLHCRQFEAPPAFTLEQVDELARRATDADAQAREEVAAFLQEQLGHANAWTIHVKEGDPVHLIIEHCDCADLIIMGTHGRHGLQRWMLGSVAEAMIKAAKIPVLVVRQTAGQTQETLKMAHLLAPINHTTADRVTLAYATGIATLFDAELASLYVSDPHERPGQQEASSDNLAGMPIQHIVRSGKTAEQILMTAKELSANLLILSMTPKRFLDMDILPSTVTQVLQYSEVPVLVVPPASTDQGGQQ